MELLVDLSTGAVALHAHDDLDRLSVQVLPQHPGDSGANGALGALAAALSVHDAGTVDPEGNVFIPVPALRRLADEAADTEGRPLDSEWERRFAATVDYAATEGWTADDGSLRAHVEWKG